MIRRIHEAYGSRALVIITIAIALTTLPLFGDERPWTVRGFGTWVDGGGFYARSFYDGDSNVGIEPSHGGESDVAFEGDYGVGLLASIEYRPTPQLGVELGHLLGAVGSAQHGRYSYTSADSIGFSALLLSLNVHLTPKQPVQVYVSPIIGGIWFSAVDWDYHHGGTEVRFGNEFVWGGGIGVDVPVAKSRWSVSLIAKYLNTRVKPVGDHIDRPDRTTFDPLTLGVGFGFRF